MQQKKPSKKRGLTQAEADRRSDGDGSALK